MLLKLVKVIMHIAILYGFYLIGTWIQQALNLFVPGSVIGMMLLFIMLLTKVMKLSWVEDGAQFFIKHLMLFFIPATVGVMNYFELFSGKGLLLVLIVLFSTVLVMGCSGVVSQWLIRRRDFKHD